MAEFCLKCFNKMWDKNLTEEQVVLSIDFCEGCSEEKPCVIRVRKKKSTYKKIKISSFFFKKQS